MEKELHWHVAYVKSCQEKKARDMLINDGVECYLPIHKVKHKWSDRLKTIEKLVLPRMIFIRTTLAKRIDVIRSIPGITKYMSNGGAFNPVIIPDKQMELFMTMVENSSEGTSVEVRTEPLAPGDTVEITDGPMKGMKCELLKIKDKTKIAVRLEMLGTAMMEISSDIVKKID